MRSTHIAKATPKTDYEDWCLLLDDLGPHEIARRYRDVIDAYRDAAAGAAGGGQ